MRLTSRLKSSHNLLSCKALIFLLAEDHAMKQVASQVKRVLPLVNASKT